MNNAIRFRLKLTSTVIPITNTKQCQCRLIVIIRGYWSFIYSNLPDPPVADLYISMDQITSTELPADVGGLQGSLENAPSLVLNGVRGAALRLDGVNQAVNFGNLRHRCLGIFYLYICLSSSFTNCCSILNYLDIKVRCSIIVIVIVINHHNSCA